MAETSDKRTGLSFWLAAAWLCCILAGAVAAAHLPMAPPDQMDWTHLTARPGLAGHLLGTDAMGRDICSRLVYGARVSLTVGFFSPCIGLIIGSLLGVVAGFYRGTTERIIMVVIDAFLAFPRLVFLLMTMAVFGSSLVTLTVALGAVCAPTFARVARAGTLRFAEREFVMAARAAGATDVSLIFREILPNVAAPMLAYLLVVAGLIVIAEGSLGFLGLGVPPPAPSWGGMIAEGREVLEQAPHVALIPSLVMFLTILSANLIGEKLHGPHDRESRL